jgi:hypothetical protein
VLNFSKEEEAYASGQKAEAGQIAGSYNELAQTLRLQTGAVVVDLQLLPKKEWHILSGG